MKWLHSLEVLLETVLLVLIVLLGMEVYHRQGEEQIWEEVSYEEKDIVRTDTALPVRFDARDEGRGAHVKNQGSLGTCWAVAASSALEVSQLPQEEVVFSADHMSLHNAFSKEQNDGGDYTMVMAYLAGWQGPVLETDDAYGDGFSPDNLTAVRHVQEMQILREKDIEAMKQAIYAYGALQSAVYMDIQNAFSSSIYYNQMQASYYYNGTEEANHDILIIGWDDRYPADRFHVKTNQDGAFICQNSWGEEFGDNGIFYVSYEDVNIGSNCIAYTAVEPVDHFRNLYETDKCGWVGQIGYGDGECWFANIYTAEAEENLAAVGFYATNRDTAYQIYAMRLEAGEELPSLAVESPLAQGRMINAGYYTVELDESIRLQEGERFAVVVKASSKNGTYPAAMEYAADEATRDVTIEDGDGYISHNGAVWTNTEQTYQCNVCLKAYMN